MPQDKIKRLKCKYMLERSVRTVRDFFLMLFLIVLLWCVTFRAVLSNRYGWGRYSLSDLLRTVVGLGFVLSHLCWSCLVMWLGLHLSALLVCMPRYSNNSAMIMSSVEMWIGDLGRGLCLKSVMSLIVDVWLGHLHI